jgi:Ca2+-binding RTX toxin-like protein
VPFILTGPKWGSSTYGTGITVTWSFADFNLDPQLAETYGGYPDFDATITGSFRDTVRSIFQAWDALTGINFVEVADSTSSQIRVGQNGIDGSGGKIALATCWTNGGGSIIQATIEFDSDAFNDPNVFYLAGLHELGHVIGLGHSSSSADLMFPIISGQRGLSVDDIRGARTLYNSGLMLVGSSASEVLNGSTADDLVYGYEGSDTINGLGGNDIIVGGRDSSDGADSLVAGGGHDLIFGNGGADTINAGDGLNTVVGGFGDDSILTSAGADQILGNENNDTINAGSGANTVVGGLGNDCIATGDGNDFVIGSEGNDTLTGGAGADLYGFAVGSGTDQVNGFLFGEGDRLSLQGQTFTLSASADGDVVLLLSGGGTIELNGVAPGNFSSGYVV